MVAIYLTKCRRRPANLGHVGLKNATYSRMLGAHRDQPTRSIQRSENYGAQNGLPERNIS